MLMTPELTRINAGDAAWLKARGLDPMSCEQSGIASHDRSLSFEYRNESGEILFRKFRTPDKNFYIAPRGAQLRLRSLDRLQDVWLSGHGSTLVITEGELDEEAVLESGWGSVTSVPNGAPPKPGVGEIIPGEDRQFSYLWDEHGQLREEVARPTRIVLFVDDDAAGHVLRDELAIRLGPERCDVVTYPAGCKDANEVLKQHGADAVLGMIDTAQPIITPRLRALSDIPTSGARHTYHPGWECLRPHLMLAPPELIVVTGRPGSGKSAWTLNWCLNLARLHGLNGAVLQFEDDVERVRREVANYVKRHGLDKKKDDADKDWASIRIRVVPPAIEEDDVRDLAWLRETIAEAAVLHGCKWIIIDPWNEIEHLWDRSLSETQYLNSALRELKRLARRYGLAIIVVAHPDKSGGRGESITEMSLYSIHGGASWKNKADGGIIVDRANDETGRPTSDTLIKIDKRKDQEVMGVPGFAEMHLCPMQRLYKEGATRVKLETPVVAAARLDSPPSADADLKGKEPPWPNA